MRSIQSKFLIGFGAIFGVFFLVLFTWSNANIEAGNRSTVKNQLLDLRNNSNSYIQQSFLTHHFTSNEIYFEQIAEELGTELSHASSGEVALYTLTGSLLYASDKDRFAVRSDELKLAIDGQIAYTLKQADGQSTVWYAYPVSVKGQAVGIVRFAKDFTPLYSQSIAMQQTMIWIALVVFAAAFLFSLLLARHITVPLSKLAKASTQVTNGNFDVHIQSRRRDEIGQLSANFVHMLEKLQAQFMTIEQDRDRLEALNQHRKKFFDQVTHELKTPLTTIMGYANVVRDHGVKDEVIFLKGMDHILNESKRLHAMVLELLQKSGSNETYAIEMSINLSSLIKEIGESMEMKAQRYKKTIHLQVEKHLTMQGMQHRLRQLIINLLDNAIKYAYSHSAIYLKAHVERERVIISVSNQSDPLDHEHIEHLFDPYYRVDVHESKDESMGLGLSICKTIVEEHGGNIQVTSEKGWTVIIMDFPSVTEQRG